MVFRFEYYENVLNKHHLNKIDWRQAATWSFYNNLNKHNYTIASVKMLDDHTVEIVKRKEPKTSWLYSLGLDQTGTFERVTINRKELSVAVDRIDSNWWIEGPFLGQRDLFYVSKADQEAIMDGTRKDLRLTFVRHNFWLHKVYKLNTCLWSNFSAWSYKRAFKSQSTDF